MKLALLISILSVSILSGFARTPAEPRLVTWSPPPGTPQNKTFSVQVRQHGHQAWTDLFVYNVKVGHQKGPRADASMVGFDFSGSIDLRITLNTGSLSTMDIRPNSYGIQATQDGNTFSFTLQQNDTAPRNLVVRVNDSWEDLCLHIVTNPPEINAPTPNDPSVFLVHPGDSIPFQLPAGKNTLYFLPGIHHLPQGLWVDLDLGAAYPLDRFTLDQGSYKGISYPQRFLLQTRQNLQDPFTTAYDGTNNADTGSVSSAFPEKNARYVRLLLLGTNANRGLFLSNAIKELQVFAKGSNKNLALRHATAGAMPGYENAVDGTDKAYLTSSGYGNWHAGESYFIPRDSTTIYIAPGAIVKGSFASDGISRITIKGRGILDGSDLRHTRGDDKKGGVLTGGIWLTAGHDNRVEGITIIDPPLWAIVMNFATRPVVKNIHLFGSVVNTDGIHMSGSNHGLIDGVFIRAPDDNIVMYHYGATSYITIKNSVFWGDDAHTFIIGLGTVPHADIHDITVENCDVLNQQGVYIIDRFTGVMCLWPNGNNAIYNVTFRDIRIDSFRTAWKSAVFHLRTDSRLEGEGTGTISHVLFQNISSTSHGEQRSLLFGAGAGGGIRDIRFENYRINGQPCTNETDAHIKDTGNVSGIRFGHAPSAATNRSSRTTTSSPPAASNGSSPASSAPGQWRFTGRLGAYTDKIAHARILDQKSWDSIYPETEAAFRTQLDDRDQPGKGLWRGEFWGKYLLSAIAACRYYHSDALKDRIAAAVKGLLSTQRSDGYIGTYANAASDTGFSWNIWCRKYTLWALVEASNLLHDQYTLYAAERFADQLMSQVGPGAADICKTGMFDGLPSSSILLPFIQLYKADHNPKYLAYARYIVDSWGAQPNGMPDILNKGLAAEAVNRWFPQADTYDWAKGYELISCVEGLVELYTVTQDQRYLTAAENIHSAIVTAERSPVGTVTFDDKMVGSAGLINTVSEICDVVYWNRLSYALFQVTGKEKYIAEMERSLYNSLLCASDQNGDWGLRRLRMAYNHIPAHNHFLLHHQCCVDNLPRGLFQAGQSVLSNIRGKIYLSFYTGGDGSVPLPDGDTLKATATGDFSSPEGYRLVLHLARPQKFTLLLRMPGWSPTTTVSIDHIPRSGSSSEGWMPVTRVWRNNDIVDVHFNLKLRWEYFDPAKKDPTFHPAGFYDSIWAATNFKTSTNTGLQARYAHVTALPPSDALPQQPAVTFFYGPLALSRDIRISGPDIFSAIQDPANAPDVSITPSNPAADIWKTFTIRIGKQPPMHFCDFASAGNTWDQHSEFNTWCPIAATTRPNSTSASPHPNVIIVNMDDMGYGDTEPYGMTGIPTPNFNRLAAQGMRFTHFNVGQPVCSPSRAALLTGCYPNRLGISGSALAPWDKRALDPSEQTIASLLKGVGYKTAMLGKWHLGSHPPFLPLHYGFESFYGLPYSHDMWPVDYAGNPVTDPDNKMYKYPPLPILDGDSPVAYNRTLADQSRLTTTLTEKALAFIRTNTHAPFFLYLAHPLPHVPLAASDKFRGKSGHGIFGDVVMELDWSIGRILDVLDSTGLSENTLLIVTSDNGPWLKFGDNAGSSGGLNEGKMITAEGGVRVPCFIRWTGHVKPASICSNLLTNMDILPTVSAIAGAPAPVKKIDGVSFAALLLGRSDAPPRKVFYYYYGENSLEAIRYENWKLVLPHPTISYRLDVHGKSGVPGNTTNVDIKQALYDLIHDPGEAYDVQTQYPEIVQKLQDLAEQARNDLGDDLTNRTGHDRRPAAIAN